MAKSSLNFRYSNSNKSPFNKTQRRTSEILQRTNLVILDELIEDEIFTESDWSEKDEAPIFNISTLDIHKKAKLTDDNNSIFKWVSKYPFNDLEYCYELRKINFKMMISFQNIFKQAIDKVCWKWGQEIVLDEN